MSIGGQNEYDCIVYKKCVHCFEDAAIIVNGEPLCSDHFNMFNHYATDNTAGGRCSPNGG